MRYRAHGPTIKVPINRYTYGIKEAIVGHVGINRGSANDIVFEDSQTLSEFSLGPSMEEDIDLETAKASTAYYGPTWEQMLAEVSDPDSTRYTFLDGQRIILVIDPTSQTLLFQCKHASFDNKQWQEAFPAEAWEME